MAALELSSNVNRNALGPLLSKMASKMRSASSESRMVVKPSVAGTVLLGVEVTKIIGNRQLRKRIHV